MVVRDSKEIGARFKYLRASRSQRDFAQEIGIPFRSYQRYESGERTPPTELIVKIAEITNVPIDWLATGKLFVKAGRNTRAGQLPDTMFCVQYPISILGKDTLDQLTDIINEGDDSKIAAIKTQIRALAPKKK